MLASFINFFTKLGLKKLVAIALEVLSSFYSHDYNFFYSKPFWVAKSDSKAYIDYLIDPRIASIDDSCNLYRDIFFYDYKELSASCNIIPILKSYIFLYT